MSEPINVDPMVRVIRVELDEDGNRVIHEAKLMEASVFARGDTPLSWPTFHSHVGDPPGTLRDGQCGPDCPSWGV